MSNKQRLMRYTAAVGSLAAAGTAAGAEQDIPEQVIEGDPGGFFAAPVDINGDGVFNFYVMGSQGYAGYSYLGIYGLGTGDTDFPYNQIAQFYDGSVGSFFVEALDEGQTVDASLDFSSSFGFIWREYTPAYEVFNGQPGFIGMRFDIPGNSPHFACVEIMVDDVTDNGAQDLHILGGVFEDESDAPVQCRGDVPPTVAPVAVPVNGLVFWLTAFLAGGVMLYTGRRRRKQRI